MKIFLKIISLITFVFCASTVVANNTENTPSEPTEVVPQANKTLVVYFSRAGENYQVGNITVGNTQKVAEYIAEQTGADIYVITPTNSIS